ncbi:hypothetical protein CU097_008251 [Rhizopus azygosporus]|uniref:Uncharacterized protein n=1 Tax=Rhizopus azygosporus TaxID=86630 RepID=A0A367J6U5_RHIAZ|nr:hypothetical protein CU097_008251 [Rhizopus azygosporus]
MIDFLNKTDKNDILVTIDYAGLTTDPDDMFQFVRYTLGKSQNHRPDLRRQAANISQSRTLHTPAAT